MSATSTKNRKNQKMSTRAQDINCLTPEHIKMLIFFNTIALHFRDITKAVRIFTAQA